MSNTKEGLSIICLNIQGNENLIAVAHDLKLTGSDAILAQEVFKKGARYLGQVLGMNYIFAPTCVRANDFKKGNLDEWGVAVFTSHPIIKPEVDYYGGDPRHLPLLTLGETGEPLVDAARVLVGVTVEGIDLRTTHGAWTRDGSASDLQRRDVNKFLEVVKDRKNIFIAGDLNAPRGGEIHSDLVARGGFKDWIPGDVTTTIDGARHRAGPLELVVDHALTRGDLYLGPVVIEDGKSDHLRIRTRIYKGANPVRGSLNGIAG